MASNEDLIRFQADKHEIVCTENFRTIEEYILFLIHLKAYEEAASLAQDRVVLDLGCNNGYGTMIIRAKCKQVIGVDVSRNAIDEACRRFGPEGIEFQRIDGIKLPFNDGRFDLITCFQVIEHIGNYESFLSEINRVLAPGGTVIFTTPNAQIRLDPGMKPWNKFHIREFSFRELDTLLRTYFHEIRVQGLFAKEFLYSIEFNRIQRAKKGNYWAASPGFPLFQNLKAIFPDQVKKRVKSMLRLFGLGENTERFNRFVNTNYSTADLYYCVEDLERALDLMAICNKGKDNKFCCQ